MVMDKILVQLYVDYLAEQVAKNLVKICGKCYNNGFVLSSICTCSSRSTCDIEGKKECVNQYGIPTTGSTCSN